MQAEWRKFVETINNIELKNENIYPDDKVLQDVLGDSYKAFKKLLQLYENNEMTHEWRYYRDGKAWLCKVQKKKRTIVWMSAWKGYMQATVYFPLRLLEKVYELAISETARQKIEATKNVGNSKPCIFEVRNENILADLEKVMQLKIRCK